MATRKCRGEFPVEKVSGETRESSEFLYCGRSSIVDTIRHTTLNDIGQGGGFLYKAFPTLMNRESNRGKMLSKQIDLGYQNFFGRWSHYGASEVEIKA